MKTKILAVLLLATFLLSACKPAAQVVTLTATALPPAPTNTLLPTWTPTPAPTPLSSLSGSGGGVITYASLERNEWQLYIVNADGGGQIKVTVDVRGGYEPNWSPDGTKIVFQYSGLWIADIATGGISRIPISAKSAALPNEYLVKPAWSPDGEWIAFLNESGTRGDIYLVRPDGTDLRRLTDSNDISRDGNLVWSPDSKQLAYSAYRDGDVEIYVMDVEDAIQGVAVSRQLTDSLPPIQNLVTSWSPDGSRLAFSSDRDGNTEIYLMDLDGSNVVRLTNNQTSDTQPAWSPGGKQIAFSSNRDGNMEIYILNVEESLQSEEDATVRRLTNYPGDDMGPVWMPTTNVSELSADPLLEAPQDNSPVQDAVRTRPADGMDMIYVPAGEFQMGSSDAEVDAALKTCLETYSADCIREWFEAEQPAHTVKLDAFWIDKTEVTNAMYRLCVDAEACQAPQQNGSDTRSTYYGDPAYEKYPVIYVNWNQASSYCKWAGGRLPTEAEWEYTAKGPGALRYPWGNEYDGTRLNSCDVNCKYGWADSSFDDGYRDTAPVGSYPTGASWVGALDMAGNVWEWTADGFGEYKTDSQVNPTGTSSTSKITLRGDAADGTQSVSRTTDRHGESSSRTYKYLGFRCVSLPSE